MFKWLFTRRNLVKQEIALLESLANIWEQNALMWEQNAKDAQKLADGWKEQALKWEGIAMKFVAAREKDYPTSLDS